MMGNSRASGHWAVNGPDRSVQGAEWAAQLETGIFQVEEIKYDSPACLHEL
jgi:hypothetical protein